jgi:molybdate transport system substrate-binding protein
MLGIRRHTSKKPIADFRLEMIMAQKQERFPMKKTISRALILLLALTAIHSFAASAEPEKTISVAAAADLSTALKEIAASFTKQSGINVKLSLGASGALTQQIENGAPFDAFFSADMGYPQQLITENQAAPSTLYRYAIGKLVLWTPSTSPLDFERQGMKTLLDPSVQKIAIANPQHAPYGRAAVAALKYAGLYEQLSSKLVIGENVSQAAQFVESGNAQIGFVALAHASAPEMQGKGKYWQVPADAYPALDQGAIVLAHSEHKKEAQQFLDFIKTKEASAILQRYGFTLPQQN